MTLLGLLAMSGAQADERSPKANYLLRCSGCHALDGSGTEAGGVPPFPGFISTLLDDPQGRLYLMHVPGVVASSLSDKEIAEVMNYVEQRWGDPQLQAKLFTTEEVRRLRATEVADLVAFRREVIQRLEAEGKPVAPYPWP
ncbi:cytochrome C [Stutzerimonas kirkiae]|uniref:Cytochrome C n=2 Tax=Stutzerimonas kirkiae TaxID=2211392 RepID=A0A4V6MX95_9GAMM|nr:cytochrome C [Stutzerimonas kirkiae]TBU93279.1 cytochrome C [Stutzerimonas kirkiae]TBV01413.1 cytochrome C [Stutzerimonas kirkiae]